MPLLKKRSARPKAPVVPEDIDPITGLPWHHASRPVYRPEPLRPTGTPPITGVFEPGQRLRDLRRENGASADDVQARGRGYSGGGSGWRGIA